jgi:hypothetical protein
MASSRQGMVNHGLKVQPQALATDDIAIRPGLNAFRRARPTDRRVAVSRAPAPRLLSVRRRGGHHGWVGCVIAAAASALLVNTGGSR